MNELNRRDFIAGSFAGSVLLATSQLPAFAEKPLPLGSLSVGYLRIPIGLKKPFSVLHVSDTNLSSVYSDEGEKLLRDNERRTNQVGGRQEEALTAAIAYAKKHADYLIHTGDLVDFHSRANDDFLRENQAAFAFGVAGDWDVGGRFQKRTEQLRERAAKALPFKPDCAAKVLNGVNFVALDNSEKGLFQEDQIAFFKEEAKKGLPMALCCHVPVFTDFIWQAYVKYGMLHNCNEKSVIFDTRRIPITDYLSRYQINHTPTREFVKYLKAEPLLKAILAGDLHISVHERFSPTAIQSVAGANSLLHVQLVSFS